MSKKISNHNKLEVCMGMGIAGIPQNPRVSRGMGINVAGIPWDGSDNCRIPMGMDSVDAYLTSSSADASDPNLLAYWYSKDKV